MAKIKPTGKKQHESALVQLARATALLQSGQPDIALPLAERALRRQEAASSKPIDILPFLSLLAQIRLELGDAETARNEFLKAVELDPEGDVSEADGGGAEKFLWLAQLCEEGGRESLEWFERGAQVLRRDISRLEGTMNEESQELLEEKRTKLANTLCGTAEVYMTDLSWEDDAEARCEQLVTEALMVAPHSPEPLQTLASIRISQQKIDDAKAALRLSLELWSDLPPEDPCVPDFSTRISLSRLLMEAEMEQEALYVLERLVVEDDQSVEAWYLGGWCYHLIGEKQKTASGESKNLERPEDCDWKRSWRSSGRWLQTCLRLYDVLDYEDERLGAHAKELIEGITKDIGPIPEGSDDDEWEDAEEEDEDSDQVMEEA